MSRNHVLGWLATTLLVLPAPGQAPGAGEAKRERMAYQVKHGDARGLAETLSKHFKGEGNVQVLADPSGTLLLINAPEKQLREMLTLLVQLDRRPSAITLEVIIADVARKGEDGKHPDLDLSGSDQEVWKRVETLHKKGTLSGLRRFRLAALENQPVSVMVGESKPITAGAGGIGGRTTRSIMYRDIGTSLEAKARLAGDKELVVDLHVKDARAQIPNDSPVLGKDENGVAIRATQFTSATLRGKLTVPLGRMVVAQGVETRTTAGQAQTLILVSARIVEPRPGEPRAK